MPVTAFFKSFVASLVACCFDFGGMTVKNSNTVVNDSFTGFSMHVTPMHCTAYIFTYLLYSVTHAVFLLIICGNYSSKKHPKWAVIKKI